MANINAELIKRAGNPSHCGKALVPRSARLNTDVQPKTIDVEMICAECGQLVQYAVNTSVTGARELLDGDEWYNPNSTRRPTAIPSPIEEEEETPAEGMYYCTECGHNHRVDSSVGQDHEEYAGNP